MATYTKKRAQPPDVDEMTNRFSRQVRVCDCAYIPRDENADISTCWAWLETAHPSVYDHITHNGAPNSALFRAYVSNVYRGMRLVRPDVIQPLGTVDSLSANCRAFGRLVDMFPCVF